MRSRGLDAGDAAAVSACSAPPPGEIGGGADRRRGIRRGASWRRADEPSVVPDPPCPPAAPSEWRRLGATVDRNDTIPGPFGQPLQRLGNAQNAFARLDGPPLVRLDPGERAIFTAVVAAPTTLSSALVLASATGQVELHVDWTDVPPTFVLLERRASLAVKAGAVEGLGLDLWRLGLEACNETASAFAVKPQLHIASGIGNAGIAVGLYAGLLRAGCAEPRRDRAGPANEGGRR